MILAGGYGTRLGEETRLRPKPMVEIGGEPVLWHLMKYFSHFGHRDFILCCGYLGEAIKEYFLHYRLRRASASFDLARGGEPELFGCTAEDWRVTVSDGGRDALTGSRVRRAGVFTRGEPFFLTYGDGLADVDLDALLRFHRASGALVTLTAARPGGRFGALDLGEDGLVHGFREKAPQDGGWVNGGFMAVEPEFLERLPPGDGCALEREPLEALAREGKLAAYRHEGFWQCMDTQRDRESLEALWRSGNAPWKVWGDEG